MGMNEKKNEKWKKTKLNKMKKENIQISYIFCCTNCWVGEKRWKTTIQQYVSYDDATYVLSCKCVYEKYYYKQRQMNWNHTCAVSKYVA